MEMNELLKMVVERDASDLHLSVGRPPTIRIDGRLENLGNVPLTPEDTVRLMESITPDRHREAIRAQHSLFLVYREGATRVVQPHVLYLARDGKVCLDAYQIAGESASGMLPGWREFTLDETSDLEPLDDAFEIAPGFDPDAPKYRHGVLAVVTASGGRRGTRRA